VGANSLLDKIIADGNKVAAIIIQNKRFRADYSEIVYSDVPVSRPTTRGGVYFSDTMAYKAKIVISDSSVSKLLSQTMLGPNTEFAKIQLVLESDSLQIFANLNSYVQKSAGFELNLVIIEALAK
jgi:hypothetical protein